MGGKNRKKPWIRPAREVMNTLWMTEDQPDVLEKLEREESNRFLIESMRRLGSDERLILVLRYYEEFTWGEISEALELPESQVSLLHGRALMVLKDSLRRKERQ
jgi:RNA polymerase sigma factor (sigma-70 family)